ncbi:MAG: PEP-CTERM sorting domain-containing protein [Planctomycetota bacterium]
MKFYKSLVAAVALLAMVLVAAQSATANPLADPGFELPLVDDGNGVGKWNPFSDSGASISEMATTMPRTGAGHANLDLSAPNGFAGFFQDVINVVPGSPIDWSVWAKDNSGTNGQGIEMRIEYRESAGDTEVSRTGNLVPGSLGSAYEQITLSDTVPAGADIARVVFAIQSFGTAPPQSVFVDDASVSVQQIPEPASIALVGLAGIAVATMRRR